MTINGVNSGAFVENSPVSKLNLGNVPASKGEKNPQEDKSKLLVAGLVASGVIAAAYLIKRRGAAPNGPLNPNTSSPSNNVLEQLESIQTAVSNQVKKLKPQIKIKKRRNGTTVKTIKRFNPDGSRASRQIEFYGKDGCIEKVVADHGKGALKTTTIFTRKNGYVCSRTEYSDKKHVKDVLRDPKGRVVSKCYLTLKGKHKVVQSTYVSEFDKLGQPLKATIVTDRNGKNIIKSFANKDGKWVEVLPEQKLSPVVNNPTGQKEIVAWDYENSIPKNARVVSKKQAASASNFGAQQPKIIDAEVISDEVKPLLLGNSASGTSGIIKSVGGSSQLLKDAFLEQQKTQANIGKIVKNRKIPGGLASAENVGTKNISATSQGVASKAGGAVSSATKRVKINDFHLNRLDLKEGQIVDNGRYVVKNAEYVTRPATCYKIKTKGGDFASVVVVDGKICKIHTPQGAVIRLNEDGTIQRVYSEPLKGIMHKNQDYVQSMVDSYQNLFANPDKLAILTKSKYGVVDKYPKNIQLNVNPNYKGNMEGLANISYIDGKLKVCNT